MRPRGSLASTAGALVAARVLTGVLTVGLFLAIPVDVRAAAAYAVQLGAFADDRNARALLARLPRHYPAARLAPARDARGRPIIRVLVGSYRSAGDADAAVMAVRADGFEAMAVAAPPATASTVERVDDSAPSAPVDAPASTLESADPTVAAQAPPRRRDVAEAAIEDASAEVDPPDAAPDQEDRVENAARAGQRDKVITIRPDDLRPAEQMTVDVAGRPLTIGGEYGITPAWEHDHRLRETAEDDRAMLDQELQLEFLYPWNDRTLWFAEAKLRHELDENIESGDDNDAFAVERGEAWVFIKDFPAEALSVQIGRQNFTERRQWWWDKDLDGVRLYYDRAPVMIEAGIGEDLARLSTRRDVDPEDDDVLRMLLRGRWDYAEDHRSEFFFAHQVDHSDRPAVGAIIDDDEDDDRDGDLDWIGIRASGKWKWRPVGKFRYWLDYGYVWGEETQFEYDDATRDRLIVDSAVKRDVSGHGVDVGLIWQPKLPAEPAFTLGYAYGSGDDDPDGTDHSYRQTGIHRNNARFRGVNRFRYYGELLRPELSNLHIWTAAAGMPLLTDSSVEFLYHYYRQDEAAPLLRDSSLRADPLGIDPSIGHEFDFVLGLQETVEFELELVTALFLSGDAYGPLSDELAADVYLKANYNF